MQNRIRIEIDMKAGVPARVMVSWDEVPGGAASPYAYLSPFWGDVTEALDPWGPNAEAAIAAARAAIAAVQPKG